MKAFLWMIVTAAIGLVSPAIAADMPVKAPLYTPPVAAQSWTGFYLSLEGGWNLGKFSPFCGAVCGPEGTTVNLDDNSGFVGGSMRYLFQSGTFVVGPEAGIQYWGFKSKADLVPAGVETPAVTLQQKIDFVAYLGARIGWTPFDRTLIFLNGGAAWGHAKGQIDLATITTIDTSFSQSLTGWYIGGGLEFKISENVVFGGEYRHLDFGNVQSANPVFALVGIGSSTKLTTDQAMGRISFKLN